MDRSELHAKLDKLFDTLDNVKDKAEDGFDKVKDKAEDGLDKIKDKASDFFTLTDDEKAQMKLGAECAKDSVQRAACRGKGWLREALTNAQIEIDGVQEKLDIAKADHDKAAELRYTEALEKYAEDMLTIAQEAADEATDAVVDAVKARKEYKDKFGI